MGLYLTCIKVWSRHVRSLCRRFARITYTPAHMATHRAYETIVNKFADDVPLTMKDLALALRVSRFSVYRWMQKGYEFQFGPLTTPGHCKAWLAENANLFKRKSAKGKSPEEEQLEAELNRLK